MLYSCNKVIFFLGYAYRGSVSNLSKNINDYSSGKEFVNQYFRQVHQPKLQVLIDDFYTAFSRVTPTLKREGFPRPSDTKLDDIGGLEEIKEEIIDEILNPIKYKEDYDSFKIKSPVGVLMYGPPGCGKTLLAQAVANEAGVNLCPVRGPELLNMSGSRLTIVNTLLSEMDGFGEKKDIYILAATNYPEVIDPAILRAGRIDLFLYIGLPDTKSIEAIMKAFIKKSGIQIGSDVDLKGIAEQCKNFNGADCTRLVQLACKAAVKEARLNKSSDKNVYNRHFIIAKEKHKPSLSSKDRKRYLEMKIRMEGKWGEESSSS
ncbi:Nuclear valosin-containing protein-like [Armadillidium nasatum]|uniref:Nuclear valosin-containing protein-like n=1 Tax=Armadillidium nasatum TaxID=96803 RepID=A0A5N5SZ53_9CRUS|nr:Nuclear valosin-containing protein-like [Armadillidium nasatum]